MDGSLSTTPEPDDPVHEVVRALAPVLVRMRQEMRDELDNRWAAIETALIDRITAEIDHNRQRAEDEMRQSAEAVRSLANLVSTETRAMPDRLMHQVALLPKPRDGRDGYLSPVNDYAPGRTYEPGECCHLRGGVWQATDRTGTEPDPDNHAWRIVAEGIDQFAAVYDLTDPRNFVISHELTGGVVHEATIALPMPLHQGPYRSDATYQLNDMVALDGGTWVCIVPQAATAPPSDEWRLVSQRGSRGKTGPRGERGEQGEQGVRGRDGPQGLKGERGERGEAGAEIVGVIEERPGLIRLQYEDNTVSAPIPIPGMNFVGIYEPGNTYERGDIVRFGYNLFVAQRRTDSVPSATAADWALLLPGVDPSGTGSVGGMVEAEADARYVFKAGDTMTGALAIQLQFPSGADFMNSHLMVEHTPAGQQPGYAQIAFANHNAAGDGDLRYGALRLEDKLAGFSFRHGGTLPGQSPEDFVRVLAADPVSDDDLTTRRYVDAQVAAVPVPDLSPYIDRVGDAMNGELLLFGPIADPLAAVTREWVETLASGSLYAGPWQVAANIPDLFTEPRVRGLRYLCLTADPDVPELANPGLPGIGSQVINNGSFIIWDEALQQWDLIQQSTGAGMSQEQADLRYLRLIGGTLTGPLAIQGASLVSRISSTDNNSRATLAFGSVGQDHFHLFRNNGATMLSIDRISDAGVATAVLAIDRATGAVTLFSDMSFQVDGQGVGFFGGAWLRKVSGTGLVFRLSSGNQMLQVEDNAGTNRRVLIDIVTGDVRYLRTPAAGGGYGAWQDLPRQGGNAWTANLFSARCRTTLGGAVVQVEASFYIAANTMGSGWNQLTSLPPGHRPTGRRINQWIRVSTPPLSAGAMVEINTSGVINIYTYQTISNSMNLEFKLDFAV